MYNTPYLRALVAVVVGMAAAVIVLGAWQVIVYSAMPGAGTTQGDLREVPTVTLLVLLAGYACAAAVGGAVAGRLARAAAAWAVVAVGGVQTLVAIGNLLNIAHPAWFMLVSPLVHLPSAWLGARLAGAVGPLRGPTDG